MTDGSLDKTAIAALLSKQIQHRQVNRVLHGHPGTALWNERELDVAAILAERRRAATETGATLNVYVATPYCVPTEPDRCGFCLFPSEEYQGGHQLDEYLGYLRREGAMYRAFFEGDAPESIYFGGGTSNLYRPAQIVELMAIVREVFPRLGPGAEITLEGIPQTYTLDKLEAMKGAGVNRVSIGVQQFEDRLIKFSGRKQKKEHVMRVLGWCRDLGLRTSVDLIFGWPTQTLDDMLRDLETAVSFGVSHITHYELNVGGRTDFALNHAATLPSIEATLEMFRASRDYLTAAGYRQATTYDWQRPDGALRFEDATRRALTPTGGDARSVDTWGWGFAAMSTFAGTPERPGWTYMNGTRVSECFAALDAGRFPVQCGYHFTADDLELTMLYQALLGTAVSRERYRALFGGDVYDKYRALWDVLADRGWLHIAPDALQLVGDGVFFTPTIQALLSRPRMQEIQAARVRSGKRALSVVS